VRLQLWDTADTDRFRRANSAIYNGLHGIVVVFDLANADTYRNLQTWFLEIERYAGVSVPRILVGNKCDLVFFSSIHNFPMF
jgi:small GTP-binding protein